ncbi:MAG TPA: hypothetical protein PKM88_05665 [bacterium]|nr:hypothetical protein [bacterium]
MSDRPCDDSSDELKEGDLAMACGGAPYAIPYAAPPPPCSIRATCGFNTGTCDPSGCGHSPSSVARC